ncbi:MAG: antibiotic biosynthesis monooxygenase [Methanobrevibacter sp.]|uniref:putative quinol monooxygenase n=1 Tax=Methanobrevibacter sp. TaxID=66852 RepID=UPI0025DD47BF|nr:putative quinol monooxygenase [Methanobrevibacter sp.]MBR0271851.1 antibiotic biosynthesis monooxygenase [Methanobrevibacter sp.]
MIIVLAKAIPNDEDAKMIFIDISSDLIEKSKAEEGNIDYNLYDDVNDGSLMFVEKWESVEDLKEHMQTEHFIKFGQYIQNLVACELEIEVFSSDKLEF